MSMLFNNICKYHPLPHSGTHTRLTCECRMPIIFHECFKMLSFSIMQSSFGFTSVSEQFQDRLGKLFFIGIVNCNLSLYGKRTVHNLSRLSMIFHECFKMLSFSIIQSSFGFTNVFEQFQDRLGKLYFYWDC